MEVWYYSTHPSYLSTSHLHPISCSKNRRCIVCRWKILSGNCALRTFFGIKVKGFFSWQSLDHLEGSIPPPSRYHWWENRAFLCTEMIFSQRILLPFYCHHIFNKTARSNTQSRHIHIPLTVTVLLLYVQIYRWFIIVFIWIGIRMNQKSFASHSYD